MVASETTQSSAKPTGQGSRRSAIRRRELRRSQATSSFSEHLGGVEFDPCDRRRARAPETREGPKKGPSLATELIVKEVVGKANLDPSVS